MTQSLMHYREPGAFANALGGAGILQPSSLNINSLPASLAFQKDYQLSFVAQTPYSLDFIGVSGFIPELGNFGISISQFKSEDRAFERGSVAYARALSKNVLTGISWHWNNHDSDRFGTVSLSFLLTESQTDYANSIVSNDVLPFYSLFHSQRYALSLTFQDLYLKEKHIQNTTDLGLVLKPFTLAPQLNFLARIGKNEAAINAGLAYPIGNWGMVLAGYTDGETPGGTLGFGLEMKRQLLQVSYVHADESFQANISIQIGRTTQQRAGRYWDKAVSLSQRGSYEHALSQIKKYRAFDALGEKSEKLQTWLNEKVMERREKIERLFATAEEYKSGQIYLKADLTYKEILKLDPENKNAMQALDAMRAAVDHQVKRVLELAQKSYEDNDLPAAERAFQVVKSVRPGNTEAQYFLNKIKKRHMAAAEELFYRGLGYYRQKNYSEAVKAFKDALNVYPEYQEAKEKLAQSISSLYQQNKETKRLMADAQRYVVRQDYKQASEAYQKILELDPQNQVAKKELRVITPRLRRYIDSMILRGKNAVTSGDFDTAERLFNNVISLDDSRKEPYRYLREIDIKRKDSIDAIFQKGEQYFAAKDWDSAISFYDEVLAKDQTHTKAREQRKIAYQKSSFDDLLKIADAKFLNREYLEAYDLYAECRQREPENFHILAQIDSCRFYLDEEVERYYNEGISYFAAENYESAIEQWEAALRIDPNHAKSSEYKKRAEQRLKALNRL